MAQESNEEIAELIARFPACITYVPVKGEVNFTQLLSLKGMVVHEIQPRRDLDPMREANEVIEKMREKEVAILVPGRHFDATGTRHGKGAGWYDRFLAAVPPPWIRIGFCTDTQFSIEPLVRESWDEPMDYVVVVPEEGTHLFYTTGARPAML